MREFARDARRRRSTSRGSSTAARTPGVNPGYALGRDYDEHPTGCSSRSPSSARARTSTAWPRCSGAAVAAERAGTRRWRHDRRSTTTSCTATRASRPHPHAPPTVHVATPLQRDHARRSSRRAPRAAARSRAPSSTCPQVDGPAARRASAAREPAAPARGLRARARAPLRQPLQAQLRPRLGLLPARLVHDEAQPAPARARRGAARPRAPAPAADARSAPRARSSSCTSLERALGEVAGLPHVSLQPQRRLARRAAGVLLTRAYHEDRGETRTKVLTPDTAHGTNPATVTMAGYEVVKVGTNPDGGVDLDDLRAKADERRRLPDAHQPQHAGRLRPEHRGDRADRPRRRARRSTTTARTSTRSWAISRPGDMGFDIVHFNLHKSFTQPHGGGGPGLGPDRGLRPHRARTCRTRGRRRRERRRASTSTTTGRSRSAACAASRATTACSCAPTPTSARWAPRGCRTRRETAVLNANYLLARLRELGVAEHLPLAFGELLHARVRAVGRADEAASSGSGRSTWPSACSTTASTRRRSTSRCSSTRRCSSSRPRRRPRRRSTRSPRRSRRSCARPPRTRDRPQRALHDAGAPPRRGRRGQAPGHPPAAVGLARPARPRPGRDGRGTHAGAAGRDPPNSQWNRRHPAQPDRRLFHRDRLRQVPRLVDVAPQRHGGVVGQQLQRDAEQDRVELGLGCGARAIVVVGQARPASRWPTTTTAAAAGLDLLARVERFLSSSSSSGTIATVGRPGSISASGPCLSSEVG